MYKIDRIKKEQKIINIIKTIINILVYIIIVPIIIINCTMIIQSFIKPNETPSIFGYKMFSIVSGSMEPTIKVGDIVIVKEIEQNQLSKNDIISFKESGSITTHRIQDIINDNGIKKYTTKGDNNNSEDKEKRTYENIEGKYIFKINGMGLIINALKSPLTLLVLITILILNYYYRQHIFEKKLLRKEVRKKYKEREMAEKERRE